jgi:hypothetical protein
MQEAVKGKVSVGIIALNLALSLIAILSVCKAGVFVSQGTCFTLATTSAAAAPPAPTVFMTLIVPCTYVDFTCYKHRFFTHLYENVTDPPEEIIFVISAAPSNISAVDFPNPPLSQERNIDIKLVFFHSPHNAAQNRNIGATLATGKFVTFFDMDDLVHPQRFQVIKYLLQQHPHVDAALFGYKMGSHEQAKTYQFENIELKQLKEPPYSSEHLYSEYVKYVDDRPGQPFSKFWCCKPVGVMTVANGWGTYRRETFLKYQYDEDIHKGEDSDLNARLILGGENFTLWKIVLGFYENNIGREQLCGEDDGALH